MDMIPVTDPSATQITPIIACSHSFEFIIKGLIRIKFNLTHKGGRQRVCKSNFRMVALRLPAPRGAGLTFTLNLGLGY